MLINLSNHSVSMWSQAQLHAAEAFGEIEDMPFPAVDPHADEAAVHRIAADCIRGIVQQKPSAVLCQGEFGLTYAIVSGLLANGIRVLYACSARNAQESVDDQHQSVRMSRFEFVRFRDYP